jgi:hypothetical protein
MRTVFTLAIVVASCGLSTSFAEDSARADFEKDIRPILQKFCVRCHGPEEQNGRIRFDTISTDLLRDRAAAEDWHETLNMLNRGEMPPEDEPQPSAEQRKRLTGWMRKSIDDAVAARRSTGGLTVMRRLNRTEYQNTMRDLLDFEMDYVRDLPPEGLSPDGFRNNGLSLRMTGMQLEFYLEAARKALDRVIVTSPEPEVFHHEFDKSNHRKWLGKPTIADNRLDRISIFLARMEPDYPESGEFLIRVKASAERKDGFGSPRMRVAIGYRPDTKIILTTALETDVTSAESELFEIRGRIENFPLPVRGQSKYPGLVIRIENVYDDGNPPPKQQTRKNDKGKDEKFYPEEPDFPKLIVESVTFDGPVFETWPPQHHRRILFDSELRESDEPEYVRQVLQRFIRRAWRRPPTDAETTSFAKFFDSIRGEFPVFEEAIRETLALVLISPDFLYLAEPAGKQKRNLTSWELASRLSYFLWSTMPDDRLLELAESKQLLQPAVLTAEVDRMIDDDRAWQFVDQFADQWLNLGGMDRVAISQHYYPEFDTELKPHMRNETLQLFMEVLRKNRSARHFVESDFAMLNEPMARLYGIQGVQGYDFRAVPLPTESHRGGLLTQASILLTNSTGEDSHPIKRAVWLRRRLLDDPPAPPPPNVPELDAENSDFAKLSIRKQLEIHLKDPSCASCHQDIDPWGIALENFDAIGRWRDEIRRADAGKKSFTTLPVDHQTQLPDGSKINSPKQLKRYLLEKRGDEFARTIVTKLLVWALGRSLDLSDEPDIAALTDDFVQNNLKLRNLIHEIVKSEPFLTK